MLIKVVMATETDIWNCSVAIQQRLRSYYPPDRNMTDLSQYILPNDTGVCLLDCITAFDNLTEKEKLYSHYVSQASWNGGLIVLLQVKMNYEIQNLTSYYLIQKTIVMDKLELNCWTQREKFEIVVKNCAATKEKIELWNVVGDKIYSLSEREKELGLGEKVISILVNLLQGTTTYFSSNCDKNDATVAQEFLTANDLSPYNTRLFKTVKNDGSLYGCKDGILGRHEFTPSGGGKPCVFNVKRGDYSPLMKLEYGANENEKLMLKEYIKSFNSGSIPAHKDGSRHWIKNKGPIVETYIGFIESYRDPFGVRGEFEGITCSNNLLNVLNSEGFKNVSLGNVLTSGYKDTKVTFLSEEDKEEDGKYNFDIENVIHTETRGKSSNGKLMIRIRELYLPYLHINSFYKPGETWDSKFSTISASYEECRAECVGIYLCLSSEALRVCSCLLIFGHTGDDADDIVYINWLNMARAGLLGLEFYSPETTQWRQAHMQARFVILRVLLEAGKNFVKIQKITGDDGKEDILLTMERSKINDVGKEAIGNFLRKLQRWFTNIEVVYNYRGGLQLWRWFTVIEVRWFTNIEVVYRYRGGVYSYRGEVNDTEEPHFLSLRSIVLERKQPRKMFVQHNTYMEGGKVKLKQYESSAAALVQSFVDRFPSTDIDQIIQDLWDKDKPYFS
ncbi:hypothetical protein KUTeg_002891 [Tegillarca granosa]|uniref:Uncharacterized protein n=1 Tax=Tegillarca granosa TaxID=220873 RepID=A0ABQ9FV22_TEGGR|nr:hypothetical protein KUTeg_002891 [Tegillarca granosa]